MRFIAFYLLVLIITATGIAIAENKSVPDGTIYGHVYDAETKQPVSGAWVYCLEAKCPKQTTDSDGYYAIENCFSPSSSYIIECTKNGYPTANNTAQTNSRGKAEVDFNFNLGTSNSLQKPESKQTQAKSWKKTFGGSSDDEGRSVRTTNDGGYIIVGKTNSYGAGETDVWLIKTDADGNKLWDRTFGGPWFDGGDSVSQTSDGGYIIAGKTESYSQANDGKSMELIGPRDIWLIKTDANGKKLWDRKFSGSMDGIGNSVLQTSDGGYIIAGGKLSDGSVSLAGLDAWLIKTDPNGNMQWDRTFGESGYYESADSVRQTIDGGYIIAGSTYGGNDGSDVWLIKTDANGNEQWNKVFSGVGSDYGESTQQTNDGGYIIAGWTSANKKISIWLIKTDAVGNNIWDRTFSESNYDSGHSVQQTSDGGYIITGSTDFGAGIREVSLIKTDANGNKVWNKTYGGSGQDDGFSVQQTNDDGYIITGWTHSYGSGGFDLWLIKTDSEGN